MRETSCMMKPVTRQLFAWHYLVTPFIRDHDRYLFWFLWHLEDICLSSIGSGITFLSFAMFSLFIFIPPVSHLFHYLGFISSVNNLSFIIVPSWVFLRYRNSSLHHYSKWREVNHGWRLNELGLEISRSWSRDSWLKAFHLQIFVKALKQKREVETGG